MRRLGVPAAALSIALGAAQLAAAAPSLADSASASSSRVAVGQTPALPKNAVSAAAPSASTKLSLDIELNTGHASELSAYAAGVGNRNSPYYHQYLTPSQVAEYFGASSAEIATVESALRSAGLTVGSASADGMFVSASGTVAQAEHAFNVTIAGYRAGSRSIYANTAAPTVPGTVAGDISGILGLNSVDYAVPQVSTASHIASTVSTKAVTGKVTSNYSNNSCSSIASVWDEYNSEFGTDLQNGSGYYTDDAISSIYGLSSLLASGDDGAGVTVGVFELENYDPTGVAQLDSCYGHSTSVSEVKVDGGPSAAANLETEVGAESALDIENIANLAPGVKIVDYAGPDYTVATDANILDTYGNMINADTAKVISSSWGECEVLTEAGSSTMQASENTLFEQAAAQGQTVLSASGDAGDMDCYGQGPTADNTLLSVDDPSSQPYVTGVGGTGMTGLNSPTPYVWNDCQSADANCGSGGGGVSDSWALPTWQAGAIASGYTTNCATAATTGCREVPDVSALADPEDGFVIDEYYTDGTAADSGDSLAIYGGTSGAAPTWAAIIALVDASTTCRLNGEAGFINPSLYTAGATASTEAAAFTDVTSGNNGISAYNAPYAYQSTTGYDMASGWGTPKASGIEANVCQAPIVSPDSYYVTDGPTRVMDTRPGRVVGPVTGPVGSLATVSLPITGANGVPSSDVSAVVLNVTAVAPAKAGNATVYPDGSSRPLASNLNWSAGETIPNLVVVPLNADGKVDLWNNSGGTINYVVDLEGYFTTSSTATGASTYTPVSPVRVVDTRPGRTIGSVTGPVAALSTTALQIAGQQGLPSTGITAVVANVTVTAPAKAGNIVVYPAGGTQPTASNVNFAANETIPNLVIVPLSSSGQIDIFNNSGGTIEYLVDVQGYFTAGTSGAKYHPLGPVRLIDTRVGQGETTDSAIGADKSLTLPLPSSYSAIIANLTVTAPASNGDLDAYPAGGSLPTVSNVNFLPGETIPNLAFIQSDSGVSLYNHSTGNTQALLDLAGYFSAS
jgi:subtilase family serine protease